MLVDRPYMRRDSFRAHRSLTVNLLIINVAVFVLQNVAYIFAPEFRHVVETYFALTPAGLSRGWIWQLLTFQFLHSGPWPWHLLFNGLALYFFGRPVEDAIGRKTFARLYFLSGVLGGILQVIVMKWIVHVHPASPVVGASAGVAGLLAAYALLFPENHITLLLFFVIPVSLKAKYLFWGGAIFSLVAIGYSDSNIAHAAHLGGFLAGFSYLRWGMQAESLWAARKAGRPRPRPRELISVRSPKGGAWKQDKPADREDLPPEEFISREVDPILDKISAQGIQSLTPEERQILEKARARMQRR